MNIQNWLDAVVQPDAPSDSPLEYGHGTRPRTDQSESACRGKPRPKRAASDSSLLELPPECPKSAVNDRHKHIKKTSMTGSLGDQASMAPSESAESSASSQRYTRKLRRKTRPERYDPASTVTKERGKHAHRSRKSESKRAQRKSRRVKGKDPATEMAHSFHAKNVYGDRLTVECCHVCSGPESS